MVSARINNSPQTGRRTDIVRRFWHRIQWFEIAPGSCRLGQENERRFPSPSDVRVQPHPTCELVRSGRSGDPPRPPARMDRPTNVFLALFFYTPNLKHFIHCIGASRFKSRSWRVGANNLSVWGEVRECLLYLPPRHLTDRLTCVWRIADSGEISNSPHTGSKHALTNLFRPIVPARSKAEEVRSVRSEPSR